MKSFDVTNVNELNASSLELKITGNTNSLIINVDDDSQAKLLFLDANIENITINAGEDSLVILNFIHFPDDDRCYRKIIFCDKDTGEEYTDLLEIHVLELKKLPEKEQNESGIIRWMRFLGAKSRKEFEKMAKEDTYIDEAYEMLKHMSADEKKRLEYEAREKAIRDYNSQMLELKEVGRKEGIAIGAEQGEQRKAASIITNMLRKGKGPEEIADMTGENLEEIQAIQKRLL